MAAISFGILRTQWRRFTTAHPLARGMISYAVLWPTGSLIQQALEDTIDWMRCLRFSIYGSIVVAPSLYSWVRISSSMWPQMSLGIGMTKAIVEQFSYAPIACASFFFGMSLLEMKSIAEATEEVRQKFIPTFKVGICVWPILQTINFSMIPEHNRLVFVSICSVMWTTFLAYMKMRNMEEIHAKIQ